MPKDNIVEEGTFGKKDLVDGMFVKCRNGEVFLKLGNTLHNLTGYLQLSELDDKLLDVERDEEWDIIEVLSAEGVEGSLPRIFDKEQGLKSIWKRTPPKSEKVIKLEELIRMHEEQLEATKKLLAEELSL